MKMNNPAIVLGLALAITGGLFGANVSGLMDQKSIQSPQSGAYMTGHVETVLTDSNGIVKEYRQSDNLITNTGENCVLRLLFQDDGAASGQGVGNVGTTVCVGGINAPWHFIALGTGSTTVNGTDTTLATETSALGLGRGIATTKTWANSTASTSTGSAQIQMERTFTNNSGGQVTVTESGLFNETSNSNTDSMFARQVFSGIAVNNGDSLTVRWTINVGGTSFTLQQFS